MINRSTVVHWDAIGFTASTLCAIHCAATPLLLTALPLIGLKFLAHPAIEAAMIVLSLMIGATSLRHGYRKHHRKLTALLILIVGFAMIFTGHFVLPEPYGELAIPSGAGTVAIAHLVNWRLCRQHRLCNTTV
jgi:uncharacterized membrane protein YfcA